MAEINTYVDPDAVGGGTGVDWANAYTSLNAWEAAEETDLPGDGDIHICHVRSSSGGDDTATCVISGWDTDSDNYIEIICNNDATYGYNRHNGIWDPSKYVLDVTDDNAISIGDENYVRLTGLQIKRTFGSAQWEQTVYCNSWDTTEYRVAYCIIRSCIDNTSITIDGGAGVNIKLYNTLLYGSGSYGIWISNSPIVEIFNCTIAKYVYFGIITPASATVTVKNTTVADCAEGDIDSDCDTIDYCATDDGDGTNAQTLSGTRANDFTDWDNDVFSPVVGSVQVNNGTDNPGSGLYLDDIVEALRVSTWDIGAWEYVAASSSSISSESSESSDSSVSSISSPSSESSESSESSSSDESKSSSSISSSSAQKGDVVWGHHTAVDETFDKNFQDNWSGTGSIIGAGDDEILTFDFETGNMVSETWYVKAGQCWINYDKYQVGKGIPTIEYKTGATKAACESDSWHVYNAGLGFTSLNWVKIRLS